MAVFTVRPRACPFRFLGSAHYHILYALLMGVLIMTLMRYMICLFWVHGSFVHFIRLSRADAPFRSRGIVLLVL